MHELAEQGHSSAQAMLGVLYHFGKGVEVNATLAEKWYFESAKQECHLGQTFLGRFYFIDEISGNLKQKSDMDVNKSVFFLEKAASQNDFFAMRSLARLYHSGLVENKNVQDAIFWLKIAAEQGDSEAQYILGGIYLDDEIVKDIHQSIFWLEQASLQQHNDAIQLLKKIKSSY